MNTFTTTRTATVGNGKTVHLVCEFVSRTACAALDAADQVLNTVDEAREVTCKRCLRTNEAARVRGEQEAAVEATPARKTYAEMYAEAEAKNTTLMAREATPEEMARLRTPEELNVDPELTSSMAIGASVWSDRYNGWFSQTVSRNVSPSRAVAQLRSLMTNENMKGIHIYVEGF